MTIRKRVIIDSGAASPLRVSAFGTDAATAQFGTLIFDANQPPLRLWATGYGACTGITKNEFGGGQNVKETVLASGFVTPAGTTAVFLCMIRKTDPGITPILTTHGYNVGGGSAARGCAGFGLCSGAVVGVNFDHVTATSADPNALPTATYVNYCIFKNYN